MRSNFETALNRDEFPDYFRGIGIYFTADPDWGNQLHIMNWQGLCGFIKTHKTPDTVLKNAFTKYLDTVDTTLKEAEDLFENIVCYYYMRKKVPALSANGLDLILDLPSIQRQKVSNIMRFLRQELSKADKNQDLELYNRRMAILIRDGGPKDIENL
ncbi:MULTISPECIES: hypothetical protein [Pseudomonas]|uniref:Uncharacterized protein n=1 Tax=Pseudomonas cichorii TaxID=36746 RepID=A0ABQ1DVR4_PSECI|nr:MULTISPECIES: hypothetical protein [Pseudomonas]QVE17491.1 hypothetical protein KGD89_01580 [Pseudomonas cichorii]SDP28684.1 hypothetical protein SAMN05216599_1307 [Pseudomonas cichorii]GFM66104.1 hypothetical protein PSCICJ_22220 [Pseudomonas cichorii]GFM77315.1 hypothetical protein PSCICM_31340 [Pseudomonas cichorii]GFM95069.1 hypothetical protein PSCICP_50410 [Pseudomonas cichorii]